MSDDYREDYGSNVRSLETRLRNVEIWKAEQILLARDGKLPGQEHATSPREENGDPVPAINDHELRIQKLDETLSFCAGNLTGKTALTQAMVEEIIATKHSVFQLPSDDELHRLGGLMEQQERTQRLAQRVCEVRRATEEAHFRAELIRLGWTPPDEKAEDSVRPLPGAGPEIANMVKVINEGQTESPLKESDRPTREQVESQIAGWNPPYSAPAEPAPGSDAEHPPLGYRLAKVAEKREPGYVFWDGEGWIEGGSALFGSPVDRWHSSPCANPITANEGDSRAAESVAIPVGWVRLRDFADMATLCTSHVERNYQGLRICPDPSIPWGEGYEASLPEEAEKGYEYLAGSEWVAPLDPSAWSAEARMAEVWRRKVQPEVGSLADRVADSIADDVQRMQVAIETLTDERDRLRAEVERLKAESTVAAVSVLVDHARGVLMHRYEGACPDSVEGPDVRDPECPVCRAIDSVSRLRTIGPGEVVVPEELFQEAVNTADWMSKFECLCDESVGHICEACCAWRLKRKMEALRSQKECQP